MKKHVVLLDNNFSKKNLTFSKFRNTNSNAEEFGKGASGTWINFSFSIKQKSLTFDTSIAKPKAVKIHKFF